MFEFITVCVGAGVGWGASEGVGSGVWDGVAGTGVCVGSGVGVCSSVGSGVCSGVGVDTGIGIRLGPFNSLPDSTASSDGSLSLVTIVVLAFLGYFRVELSLSVSAISSGVSIGAAAVSLLLDKESGINKAPVKSMTTHASIVSNTGFFAPCLIGLIISHTTQPTKPKSARYIKNNAANARVTTTF